MIQILARGFFCMFHLLPGMYKGQKTVVILPAFNSSRTLERTVTEIPGEIVDEIILVDDCSTDNTVEIAEKLGMKHILRHDRNMGYGANQKTCYRKALELGADIVVMLHPDYQYTPLLIFPMVSIIGSGLYKVVLGSRILGRGALKGGMPLYKYVANRILTFVQNLLMAQKLSEYHTGYRAFAREVLENSGFERNSNDYIFDNEMIAMIFHKGYDIAEVTCPTKYCEEASTINFRRSIKYGLGVLRISFLFFLNRKGIIRWKFLGPASY
jgi:glycosyltransferase involved in cell wall biosynthesis